MKPDQAESRADSEVAIIDMDKEKVMKIQKDIDKDTDIDKEMIDIVLGLPKGYSKTEEKETVISNLKSALSNLPKHS